nr:rhodanese-like domain-containing protein [uncultured Cohaesibacter sp.]
MKWFLVALSNAQEAGQRLIIGASTAVAFVFLFIANPVSAATPLVSPQWIQDHISDNNLVILDLQPPEGYARVHIVGAINTDFNKWRQPKPKKGMALPDVRYLNELIGSLGISKDSHVVLAPIGVNASEIAVATRIYWTFKVLGHEDISILDGGLIAYSKLSDAKWSNQPSPLKRTKYESNPDLSKAPQADEVLAEQKKGTSLVDYRSVEEYFGKVGGGRPGTIPNAKNLPFDLLVESVKGGRFLPVEQAKQIYAQHGIPMEGPQIAFCNSGHRASLGWFVSHELIGNKDVRMYDGSMAEWTNYPDYPIVIPKQ